MHIERSPGINRKRIIDNERVKNQVRQFCRQVAVINICATTTRLTDTLDILPVCLEQHGLAYVITQMKMQSVFNQNRRVTVIPFARSAAHKNRQAVMTVDLQLCQAFQGLFAIDIHTEDIPVIQPYAVDKKRRSVSIINLQLQRRTALLRDNRIEP